MGCSSCSSGGCSVKSASSGNKVSGCGSKGCSSGGCNRLNTFDWLGSMELPSDGPRFNIVEVRFKGGRKDYYKNKYGLPLITGDPVVVDAQGGYHIGFVSLQGELVRLQMKKKKVADGSNEVRTLYRKATEKEMEKLEEARNRELPSLFRTRQLTGEMKLNMKLSDVEFQADNTKATFYYSSEDRVDFREMIKVLGNEFKIRVEMRQISLRQEAGRLGGIGSCGRELCCSTWLTDFKSVSTSAARYQNLSLNPTKLAGQCGRLKCCLNYELDTYLVELKDIPKVDRPLQIEKGEAFLQKTDIFKKLMWFAYKGENSWFALELDRVRTIQELNKKGQKALGLTEDEERILQNQRSGNHELNDDLIALDAKYKALDKNKKRKKKKKPRPNMPGQAPSPNQRQGRPPGAGEPPIGR